MYFPYAQAATSAVLPSRARWHCSFAPAAIPWPWRGRVTRFRATRSIRSHRSPRCARSKQVVGTSVANRRFSTRLLAAFAGAGARARGASARTGVIAYGVSQAHVRDRRSHGPRRRAGDRHATRPCSRGCACASSGWRSASAGSLGRRTLGGAAMLVGVRPVVDPPHAHRRVRHAARRRHSRRSRDSGAGGAMRVESDGGAARAGEARSVLPERHRRIDQRRAPVQANQLAIAATNISSSGTPTHHRSRRAGASVEHVDRHEEDEERADDDPVPHHLEACRARCHARPAVPSRRARGRTPDLRAPGGATTVGDHRVDCRSTRATTAEGPSTAKIRARDAAEGRGFVSTWRDQRAQV